MLPPKMGDGVSGLSVGTVHGFFSAAGAAAGAVSARTTTLLRAPATRGAGAGREAARES